MKQLLVLSGKGGTGKTTIVSAFVKLSGAKAYADCDVDAPNLHLIMGQAAEPKRSSYFGMPKAEIDQELCTRCGECRKYCRFNAILLVGQDYTVDPYACEGCGVCEFACFEGAVSSVPAVAGELMLYSEEDKVFSTAQLKMGSGNSGFLVTEVKKQMQDTAAADAELAIIDGSPGIGCPVIASLSGVDLVLVVAEPSVSGISDMVRILKTAGVFRIKTVVCTNKYDTNLEKADQIEEFCQVNQIPFAGRVPFDETAVKAINNGLTIVDLDCASGRAVRDVYAKTMAYLAINNN